MLIAITVFLGIMLWFAACYGVVYVVILLLDGSVDSKIFKKIIYNSGGFIFLGALFASLGVLIVQALK
jgi:hypothetical protein